MARPRAWVSQLYATSELVGVPSPATEERTEGFDLRRPPVVLLAPAPNGFAVVLRGPEPDRLPIVDEVRGYLAPGLTAGELQGLQRLDADQAASPRSRMELIARLRTLGLTDSVIGELLGMDATTAFRWRQLHAAAPALQDAVCDDGPFSLGHARVVLRLSHEEQVRWVRAFQLADRQRPRGSEPQSVAAFALVVAGKGAARDANTQYAQDRLSQAVATEVRLDPSARGGRIRFAWSTPEELAGLFERLAALARPRQGAPGPSPVQWLTVHYRDNDELQELVGGAFDDA